jgi:DNA-binding MarR family transcriptional regulator
VIDGHEESLMHADQDCGRLFLHLKAAQAAMRAALDDALADLGITAGQLLILRAIDANPAASSAELARQCLVSPQAMVVNLTRLETAGLIDRTPAKGGGRSLETHFTQKGLDVFERAGSRVLSAERYVAQTLGEDVVAVLDRGLQRLTDTLEKSLVVTTSRTWDVQEA